MTGTPAPIEVESGVEGTDRWRGLGAAAILAVALGLVTRRPALLLVAGMGLALVAYARVVAPPELPLSLSRTVQRPADDGDGRIGVEVAVEHTGTRTIPDLRLVDGVPSSLSVASGSPALATSLRPGETVHLSYAVEPREGSHEFGDAAAVARDVAGVVERRAVLAVDGREALAVSEASAIDPPAVRPPAARFAGGAATAPRAEGGVAFHGTREYRPGDDVGRIDWDRYARSRDLRTVEYDADRGTTIVIVVDARTPAACAPSPEDPTAVERSLTAAASLAAGVSTAGHRLGLVRLGPDPQWIAPSRGRAHERRVRETLAERPPFDGEHSAGFDWLTERLGGRVDLLVLSPLIDEPPARSATRLQATGTPVTLLSPDPTAEGTPGQRLARIEREQRIRSLRTAGVAVADWPPATAIERALRRLEGGR